MEGYKNFKKRYIDLWIFYINKISFLSVCLLAITSHKKLSARIFTNFGEYSCDGPSENIGYVLHLKLDSSTKEPDTKPGEFI